jgi:hypothetical protein
MTITACQITFWKREAARRGLGNIIPLGTDIISYEAAPESISGESHLVPLISYMGSFMCLSGVLSLLTSPTNCCLRWANPRLGCDVADASTG